MDKLLRKINISSLIECVKNKILSSEQTIIPGFLITIHDISSDGACQFRSIANQINYYNGIPDSKSKQTPMAKIMYDQVKNIVINVLPTMTNQQLFDIFKLEEVDFSISPIENINNYISDSHSGIIKNLNEYSRKFKFGTYTTNFELRILTSEYLSDFWLSTFNTPVPCVIVYIYDYVRDNYIEIDCKNRNNSEFITFRILYVDDIHYESMYLTTDIFNETIINNSCRI